MSVSPAALFVAFLNVSTDANGHPTLEGIYGPTALVAAIVYVIEGRGHRLDRRGPQADCKLTPGGGPSCWACLVSFGQHRASKIHLVTQQYRQSGSN